MSVKVFHTTTKLAMQKAHEFAESIRKKKRTVPLRNIDGTTTGQVLEFSRVQVDPVDDGIAQIALTWEVTKQFE